MTDPQQPQLPGEGFPQESNPKGGLMLSNKAYDRLNPITRMYLPLLIGFYGTLSQIWKWPLEVQIIATLAALQVLLSGIVTLSAKTYSNSEAKYDGDIIVDDEGMIRGLHPNTGQVTGKDAVFKITSV